MNIGLPFFTPANFISDGNIRYYEYENDKFEYLSEYQSPDPQRGIAFLPKRGVNLQENEVLRCFKTVKDAYIEPISFIVPRRSEMFQSDIYPPCFGLKPGTTATEWFGGKTAVPPKISLESVYDGGAPEEVPADTKPSSSYAPAPTPKAAEAPKPTPAPAPTPREPPSSLNDNKQSLASQAAKFVDKDGEASDDDASSFEEVVKPVQRPSASRQEEKAPEGSKPTFTVSPTKAAPPDPTPALSAAPGTAAGAAAGIKDHLTEIKATLQQQNKIMSDQSDQIALLMREVSQLKLKVGGQNVDREKDERIRQLELELEEARS